MEVSSFEKTLHNFIREGGWRSPKGVDEILVGKIYAQFANIRLRVGPRKTPARRRALEVGRVSVEGISP